LIINRRKKIKPLIYDLDYLVKESIKFIQDHEPEEGYFLAYSGGKDSIVTEDLARISGVSYVNFYTLMHDPPELIKFICSRNFQINIIKSERNFYQMIEKWFPPRRKARWCCSYIKEDPSTKIPLPHKLLGIRKEESTNRAKQGWISQRMKKKIHYHPIFDWPEWAIWQYIDDNNLEYCSLYDEGFSRLGCIICPFHTLKQHQLYRNRWPLQFKMFEKAVENWWCNKGFQRQRIRGYAYFLNEYLNCWYKGAWPKIPSGILKNNKGFNL